MWEMSGWIAPMSRSVGSSSSPPPPSFSFSFFLSLPSVLSLHFSLLFFPSFSLSLSLSQTEAMSMGYKEWRALQGKGGNVGHVLPDSEKLPWEHLTVFLAVGTTS